MLTSFYAANKTLKNKSSQRKLEVRSSHACIKTWTANFFHSLHQPCLHLSQEEKKECAALLHAGMEARWLHPVVSAQYPLDKAAQAHHDIIESPGATGKIVLTMS